MATEDNKNISSERQEYNDKYQKYLRQTEKQRKLDSKIEKDRLTKSEKPIKPTKPVRPNTSSSGSYHSNNNDSTSGSMGGPNVGSRRRNNNIPVLAKNSDIVYLEPVKKNVASGTTATAVVTSITTTASNGDVKNIGLEIVISKTGAFTGISTSHKAQLAYRNPYYDKSNKKWCHTDDMGHWIVKETVAANYIKIKTVSANSITLEVLDAHDLSAVGSMMSKWTDSKIEAGEREVMFLYILPLNYLLVRKKKSSIMEYFHDQDRSGANKDIMFIRESNCCGQQFAPSQWAFKEGSEAAQWYGTTAVTELVNTTSAWTNYGIYHNIIPTLDEIFENDN